MNMNTSTTDLASTICNAVISGVGEVRNRKNPSLKFDVDRLSQVMRRVVKAGYDNLLSEMRECSEAFPNNRGMLAQVMGAGCMSLAIECWKEYTGTACEAKPASPLVTSHACAWCQQEQGINFTPGQSHHICKRHADGMLAEAYQSKAA